MILYLVVFIATTKLPFEVYPYFSFPDRHTAGQDPEIPWSYITRDYVNGLCALIKLAIVIPLGAIFLKRCWPYSFMAIWMSVLWSSRAVVEFVAVLLHTDQLFDPVNATSTWRNFDEYFATMQSLGNWVAASHFFILLPFVWLVTIKVNSRLNPKDNESDPTSLHEAQDEHSSAT
ncbi:MAG: hypothetical protein WEB58_15690 [Planctomycetaceae bacterium]